MNTRTCRSLKKTEKHDIDVVIDRVKVRADLQQRLAESIEGPAYPEWAATKADGRALALEMDTGQEHLFSRRLFACPVCQLFAGRAGAAPVLVQLTQGACPACDGIGHTEVFDPVRAWWPSHAQPGQRRYHRGWDAAQRLLLCDAESLAKHYAFDIEAPFESLPAPVQYAILHGSGDGRLPSATSSTVARKGQNRHQEAPLQGIIPNMARRYRETDSAVVREDLARFRSTQPCPECHGVPCAARPAMCGRRRTGPRHLRSEPRHAERCATRFTALKLTGAKAEIADKVVREIATRLQFSTTWA